MSYLFSLIAGSLLAFMVSANGIVGEAAGNYASSVIIHFIGLIGIIGVLIITKTKIKKLHGISLWSYTGGLIGILTLLFCNITYSHLGVSLTVALGLLGQSITAILIDHNGWFGLSINPFNKKKIFGFAIILLGIFMMAIPS